MEPKQSKDPLHGITLKEIVEKLEAHYGFDTLGELIGIKCFRENPSVQSSLTFLRKTDWARKKVEALYLRTGFERGSWGIFFDAKKYNY